MEAAALGEAAAWRESDLSRMIPHQVPSPWFRAYQYLHHGDPDSARATLLADFADPGPPRWLPPDAADERTLEALVALLPRPLPIGNPYSEHALADILLRLGEYDTAAHYAADSYRRVRLTRSPRSPSPAARQRFTIATPPSAGCGPPRTLANPAWISQALRRAPELVQFAGGSPAAGDVGSR